MKRLLPNIIILPLVLLAGTSTSCTTIANRRDLYFPQTVWGPYTRMKCHGIPKPTPDQLSGAGVSSSSSDAKKVIKPQG
ncbi:MAG: hypothetical protein WCP60_03420 [bacterium]